MPSYSLSVSDLMLLEDYRNIAICGKTEDEQRKDVEKILFHNGMDTKQYYELTDSVYHRNLQNEVVFCPRYEGQERLDEQWIKSGYASLDAIIASSKDVGFMRELRGMSKTREAGVIATGGYDIREDK